MDLAPYRRRLPLEMNCEMYKFLKFPIQKKFIWGMGQGIYKMFGPKLLIKTKRVCNPHGNTWNATNTSATITADGLNVSKEVGVSANVFAEQPFTISGPHCRVDEFPGTILYYYEVKSSQCTIGFSDGEIPLPVPEHFWIGEYSNTYAITVPTGLLHDGCRLAGEPHHFELPVEAIRPRLLRNNICGCGLVLDPVDKLWIFFTLNSKLLGRKIQISPTVDRLFPTVKMPPNPSSAEANFGNDPAKPFKYDIKNCPGLELSCI